jgi:hypothetical protein
LVGRRARSAQSAATNSRLNRLSERTDEDQTTWLGKKAKSTNAAASTK